MANDTITAIDNWAGTYGPGLILSTLNKLDVAQSLRVVRNLREPLALAKIKANPGLRPNDTSIESPKNPQRTWSKRVLTPRTAMKIFQVIPEEYRTTFLSKMLEENAVEVPEAQYIWQEEFAKLAAEINDNIYFAEYHGDAAAFDAATAYTGGTDFVKYNEIVYACVTTTTAGQTPDSHPAKWSDVDATAIVDGPGTILAEAITDGSVPAGNVVSTGSITSSNAWTKVNDMFSALSSANNALRNLGGVVRMSNDVYDKYIVHEKASFSNTQVPDDADGVKYVWNSGRKWKIQRESWMGTSQRIIFDAKAENLVMGTNQIDNVNKLGKIIPTLHGYKAICKFILAFQIADCEILFCNNQA